ncbi:MAG: hypothetical protein OEN23_13925 [Paracoccaceae bacterium]|nr:hypothetical protein [Paracoccaceae bacterium]
MSAGFCLAAASALNGGLALSDEGPGHPTGDVSVYAGALGVSDNIEDRVFAGMFANAYLESGIGFHLDLSGQWREEDAGFGALGISAELSPGIRPKIQIGTSTDNDGILPELFLDGSARVDLGSATGTILDVGSAYRDFRNGVEEISIRGEVIKYFSPFSDGSFMIGQAYVSGIHADPGSNIGWEARAGVTYVVPSAWTVGVTVAGGQMAYDDVTTLVGVENDFLALRPHISFSLSDRLELFTQGEFLTSDEYDIAGGLAGIKIKF